MSIRYDKTKQRWRFEFESSTTGRRIRTSKLLPAGWSRQQAEEYDRLENARLYASTVGVKEGGGGRTIDEAVKQYLTDKRHLKTYDSLVDEYALLLDYYEGRPIPELPAVAAAYAKDHTGKLKPATIRNRIAYLRAACRYVWKKYGWCEHDPAGRLIVPEVKNARHFYLDRRQMLTVARRIKNPSARAVFRVAFYSGMRLGEIYAAEVDMGNELFKLVDTKNGEPRYIPIHPKALPILRSWHPWGVTKYTSSKHAKAALRAVGLGHMRFHDSRHSAASEMINNGVELYTVGGVLGHKSTVSTKRYSHLRTATLTEAVKSIGRKSRTRLEKSGG